MYIIDQDPAQVIPNISEDFITSKFIILIARYYYHDTSSDQWIAILDLSTRIESIVSWFGSNIKSNASYVEEWSTGQFYNPQYGNFYRSKLIDIITRTWNQLNGYNKTIYICDSIIEVEELLQSNNINISPQTAIISICNSRNLPC